jgi:diguanylate cyclase (GGDEF)-like protein/PAS domain S-box-containing protein
MKDQSKTKQTLIQKRVHLNEASEYAENIINTVREPLIVLDQDLRVVTASRSFYEFFKVKPEETEGQLIYNLGNDQWDIPKLRELLETILPQKTTFDNYEVEHYFATIGRRIMLLNARQIQRALGKERVILLDIEDITERKEAEQMLKESERHLDQVLQFFPDPMLVIDRHGKVTTWNRHMEDLTGVKAENMLGKGDYEYALPFYGERRPILIDLAMEPNDKIEGRYDVIRRHNNTISGEAYMPHLGTGNTFISGRAEALYNSQGEIIGAIESIRDITERKQAQEALEQSEKRYRELSIIDNLTQLYNSMHFYQQLKMEIDRANRYKQPLTLLLLDLDDFKQLNDAYGHIEGDLVLSRVGQMIKRCMRQTDSAYRYGGEEFTILLPMSTGEDGAVMAERIRTEFKKEIFPPVSGKEDIHMTVSIGLAQYKPQEEMKAFVHRVDQLMYQAKKNGKDRVCSES